MIPSFLTTIVSSLAFLLTLPVAFSIDPALGTIFEPSPVILDDDGSPDGVIALSYMLQNPKFDVKAITVVQGEAHPDLFARNLMRALNRMNVTGIPVAAGRNFPLVGNNAFPALWRTNSDNFWGLSLPSAVESVQPISAVQLIIKTVKESSQPVIILVTGPLTNIAEALRTDPTIASNIASINIMGGAVYVPGNLTESPRPIVNSVAEWNIWVDPVAAQEVFLSGLPIYLTPLDATNQVKMTTVDSAAWRAAGTSESILASDILDLFLKVSSPTGVSNWDTVAAINLSEASFCPKTPLPLNVITTPGVQQGRTVVSPGKATNVNVCLDPNVGTIPKGFSGIFQSKAQIVPEPDLVLSLLAVSALVAGCWKHQQQ